MQISDRVFFLILLTTIYNDRVYLEERSMIRFAPGGAVYASQWSRASERGLTAGDAAAGDQTQQTPGQTHAHHPHNAALNDHQP